MKRFFRVLGSVTFVGALVSAAYALIRIYLARKGLPPGVCPVDNNRPWLYLTLVLIGVSLASSWFGERQKKLR